MTATIEDVFWAAHEGLPREAPGSPATTALLLRLAGPLPAAPRIVDIGCGTGPAALALAAATGGEVVGVDLHEPFLARLRAAADAAGLGDRIRTVHASMEDLPLPAAGVDLAGADLVWADGSAYIMGFDAALRSWRGLLAPGGVLVLTEAEWTTRDPAPGARAFWDEAYPAMRDTAANVAAALDTGWTVAATYLLPDSDWDVYYGPLGARLDELARAGTEPSMLAEVRREIDVRREHGSDYGYTAYVLRPR
ncbi:class I SAM-dependent methyltransferase [Pseudonocardia sp. KRD291]|uniref:class I SAM-dependent methyltransferase n=1 Tax=Pseudonocardia sp. KRD291 TaxID=2792007 RepID=UPI001C4A1136|nr:class I SAM-dependent methyltransferase [Pseudonocardia sp. KRD291]MBW0106066.1 class I SAM-dependent methyltransferase [Pseudonocardia sp. KRD291]